VLIEGAQVSGEIPPFTINAKFLVDALKSLGQGPVIYLTDAHSPIRFSSRSAESIIMPLRSTDFKAVLTHLTERYNNNELLLIFSYP
jgi:hypothetical protein